MSAASAGAEPDPRLLATAGRLLEARAGLVFPGVRREALAAAVAAGAAAAGNGVAAYLARLDGPEAAAELQALYDAVTVHETAFFRNPSQFEALAGKVLPELLARAAAAGRRLRLWSAGCSTGEEAWSLAVTLLEGVRDPAGWDLAVVGSDLARPALELARQGVYAGRSLAGLGEERRRRWFEPAGAGLAVGPELRALARFEHHNLLAGPAPAALDGPPQVIFCRNVTIYLGVEATRRVIAGFHELLAPGGYLFLGHAETLWRSGQRFELTRLGDAFVYRKGLGRRPAPARPWPPRPRSTPSRDPGGVAAGEQGDAEVPGMEALRAALAAGRYGEVEELAARRVAADRLDAEAYLLRALALQALGRAAEAVADLHRALYADPGLAPAELALAVADRCGGDPAAARRHYRNAAAAFRAGAEARWAPYLDGRPLAELIALCDAEGGEAIG